MANPTPPSITYSYSGFQAEQQDFPFPGTQLDNDLAELDRGITDTITALADVRRSDGALKNGIVTPDSMNAAVTTLFTEAGVARDEAEAAAEAAAASAASMPASFSPNGIALVGAANYAAMRGLLDLEPGVDVQAYDADLAAWAGVNPSSYSTTAQIAAAYQPLDSDLEAIAALSTTAYGRALLALASSTALQAYIGVREVLTAARTYYVRTDGSDSNNGLANTSGGAFLTLQKAFDTIKATLDTAGYTVTIQADGGTYAGRLQISGWTGGGAIVFDGGGGTISKTVSGGAIGSVGVLGGVFTYQNVTITTTAGNGIQHAAVGKIVQGVGTAFGAVSGNAAILCSVPGAYHENQSAYTTSGTQARHFWATCEGAFIYSDAALTISGTPNWTGAFAQATKGSVQKTGTITGAATGKRFIVEANGAINTNGAGLTYLPGDVAGDELTGGVYK